MRATMYARTTTGRNLRRHPAFSLVELLVVIGIISLLIGIALPAFSAVRTRAKIAATTATLTTIGTGVETFRADDSLGGAYPPSYYLTDALAAKSPYSTGDIRVGGASLIVWALAGADLLGTPGFRDVNGNDPGPAMLSMAGYAPWADDTHSRDATSNSPAGLYFLRTSDGQPYYARKKLIDSSKFSFPQRDGTQFIIPSEVSSPKKTLPSYCFLDKWDQPILYYRANTGKALNVDDETIFQNQGTYNIEDNINITGTPTHRQNAMDFGAGNKHFEPSVTSGLDTKRIGQIDPPVPAQEPVRGTFGWTLWDPNVTVKTTVYRPDTFILLSPGPDALFGTPDDITTNFTANK